jgi:hypothetical protein
MLLDRLRLIAPRRAPADPEVDEVRARLRAASTAEELDEALGTRRLDHLVADGLRELRTREALLARVEADTL